MPVTCERCGEDENLEMIAVLDDGRRSVRCNSCGYTWIRGEARPTRAQRHLADPDEPPIQVFKDDDEGFRTWLRSHSGGYYLNVHKNPLSDDIMLHEVGCPHIGDAPEDQQWTTPYMKVCSRSQRELLTWARETGGQEARRCRTCDP